MINIIIWIRDTGYYNHIFARCYYDHLVAATSHRGHHMSPLLLRDTAAMVIRVMPPGPVATMGHSSNLPINHTSLAQSGTDPHQYLLTSSALRRWSPWMH
jgi:hypothetical protein